MQRSDLPFGSEFSPSQVDLPVLLSLAFTNQGNVKSLQSAIQSTFFSQHGGNSERNRKTLAMNCRLGMKAYGLIDDSGNLTELGHQLYSLRDTPSDLFAALARHILANLKGMALVQCIRDMTAAGEKVDLTTLRAGLAVRGLHYPAGGKHPSMMRLWLARAGVFVGNRWQIDDSRLNEIVGATIEDFDALTLLTPQQRAFLLALANTGIFQPQPANEIVKLATATFGVAFPEKSLPKQVLNALVDTGFIVTTKTTSGRGAKPFMVAPTDKMNAEIVRPLLAQIQERTDPKLVALLKKPLSDILTELSANNRYVAGLALEALAFKLMRLLDMDYVKTRLRAEATGGAEVDLVFESARLVFSRWQIQCKNTDRVSLDDVAKEVGLTYFLKSNAVIMVSTGKIGTEARRYANKMMAESNLCIVMIDGADLDKIRGSAACIVDVFNREARHAMTLKKLDL